MFFVRVLSLCMNMIRTLNCLHAQYVVYITARNSRVVYIAVHSLCLSLLIALRLFSLSLENLRAALSRPYKAFRLLYLISFHQKVFRLLYYKEEQLYSLQAPSLHNYEQSLQAHISYCLQAHLLSLQSLQAPLMQTNTTNPIVLLF